jgi:FtsP/CotA-like multicopper oxidase with cupredoxin domain
VKPSTSDGSSQDDSTQPDTDRHRLSRRRVLVLGGAGAGVVGLGAGAVAVLGSGSAPATASNRIAPTDPEVRAAERARQATGRITSVALMAAPGSLDLAGRSAQTWLYNGSVGREIRLTAGDELRARLTNRLASPTTVHWHGLALRNDMDGVPDVTAPAIAPGTSFEYQFIAPDPGTYWFHPHVGAQLDSGLIGALIVEDPNEPLRYDDDVTLVFDDWLDGVTSTPDQTLEDLRANGMPMDSMGDMDMSFMEPTADGMGVTRRQPLGEDTGDVTYPLHLVNGQPPADPLVVEARPKRRLRLRLINAGSDTAYEFSVGGHRLQVVASDGFPVEPVTVDSLVLGMGERFDVLVEVGDGAFPVVAVPVGKPGAPAFAVLRTGSGGSPEPARAQRGGRRLHYRDLVPEASVRMPARQPDRTLSIDLTMEDGGRAWSINGKRFPDHEPLDLRQGERVRLELVNKTMMFHPMHVHGHTFGLVGYGAAQGSPGLRKDTVNVLPMQRLTVDFDADNPGQWLTHCHNAYHGELGMMTVLSYVR